MSNNPTDTAPAIETLQKAEEVVGTIGEKTGESVKAIASTTGETLEKTTNKTLEFLGIPIDINHLMLLAIDWSVKLILAGIIFLVGIWIGKRLLKVANLAMQRSRLDATAANFLSKVLYGLMLVAVSLAALNKLGINTNSFVAILGAATVAIGLALKDQLSNLAAGVMIVVFRPFNRGDSVMVGGESGVVLDITLMNTRIRTPNNHEVVIPNGDIMAAATVNYSSLPQRRVDVAVGIGYDSDIEMARQLMIAQAKLHESVLEVPEPVVRVTALADSAVNLTLYVWTENSDWFVVQCDLLEAIKYSFDKHGITLPFPQRSVSIEGLDYTKLNQLLTKFDGEFNLDNTKNDKI